MQIEKLLEYTKEKTENYFRIDSIISGLETRKDKGNSRDVNSFIRSKNKINRAVEVQAINNVNIDQQIENWQKWKEIISEDLEKIKKNNIFEYRIIMGRLTGFSYDRIIIETKASIRVLKKIWSNFIMEITVIAMKNNLIDFNKFF